MVGAVARNSQSRTTFQPEPRISEGILINHTKGEKIPYLILRIQDENDLRIEIQKKQDEFLDVYSFYLATRYSWIREEVKLKAYELHILDPAFNFQV